MKNKPQVFCILIFLNLVLLLINTLIKNIFCTLHIKKVYLFCLDPNQNLEIVLVFQKANCFAMIGDRNIGIYSNVQS